MYTPSCIHACAHAWVACTNSLWRPSPHIHLPKPDNMDVYVGTTWAHIRTRAHTATHSHLNICIRPTLPFTHTHECLCPCAHIYCLHKFTCTLTCAFF